MNKKTVVFGIPCFNEEENISRVFEKLESVMKPLRRDYSWEYIFVDNGSDDTTRIEIEKLTRKDKRVTGVFLSRNFGPESSAQATLDYANGDAFMLYECDMQDPVERIPDFLNNSFTHFYFNTCSLYLFCSVSCSNRFN